MPHITTSSRKPAAAALLILLLACVGLAACGGSSSGKTSSAANAAATSTPSTGSTSTTPNTGATGPSGRGAGRFAAMRECLQKNGITLPTRPSGAGGPRGGGFFPGGAAGGPQLPKGVTRAQYEAALKKCGGGNFDANGHFNRTDNPAFKEAIAKYAACLRENGVNVPAPNTSGKGPVFDTKGLNPSSAQFKAAETKCRSVLTGLFRNFRRPAGAGGAPGAGGPPPGGEGAS